MKKIFMLMFCVVMAFALAGCGGSDEKMRLRHLPARC